MNIYFLADSTSDAIGGFSVLIVAVLGLIGFFLVICWIAFPFIVLSKFNELLKIARKTERHAEQTTFALTKAVLTKPTRRSNISSIPQDSSARGQTGGAGK